MDPIAKFGINSQRKNIMKFIQFFKWVADTFNTSYQDEIEHYLGNSTDLADLEHRMAVLARRGFI
jgi:hypothetical protein